jgi:hypothetical protein
MSSSLYIQCPHCERVIEIIELNCCIFRCGVYCYDINKQIDSHLGKEECEDLVRQEMIYGCGKPFQIIVDPNSDVKTKDLASLQDKITVVVCGYDS